MAVIVSIPSWVMPSGRSLNVADPAELWRFCDNLRLLMWCHQWQLPPAWWRRQMLLRQVFFCDKKKQWKNLMGLSSRYVCRKPRKEGHLTYVGRLVDEVTKFPVSDFCPRFRKFPVTTISYPITFWMHFKNLPKKYSDMLNMKALVGIRIILMGKEYEWWVFWLFFIRKEFISVWSTCKNYCFFAKLIILCTRCTGFLKCGKRCTGCTEVHWVHLEKNSGKVDKNSANGVE